MRSTGGISGPWIVFECTMKPAPWKILSQRVVLDRWWMKLRVDEVALPDGTILPEYHVLEYPDWTLSLCVTTDNMFVLVEQYRHAVGTLSLEFASGMLEEGEDPARGAARELEEETGFLSPDWTHLGSWAPDPSRHNNSGHVFLARRAACTGVLQRDDTEDLRVVLLDRDGVMEAIASGRILHGMHVAAFYKALAEGL
ncbi:MAG: NUDIX hydrolase [Bacteroidetes bacterium CG12_big_fil_rev_8_21_14_0_65_60_17]|nr:MAG: NUDIX hydrolase [Bacteroidetes bacterium CG12_big_fil_rev_8_21_14_0_65_60_17]